MPTRRLSNQNKGLESYAFIAGSSLSMTVQLLDYKGNMETLVTVTVGVAAKSLEKLVIDAGGTWLPGAYRRAMIQSLGGAIYWNNSGNGDATVTNGVTAANAPTTSSIAAFVGMEMI